ncbi:MAG: 4Fe-4S dicluster domain-containing protein [Candidatus Methanofastidiosia archaeon]
MTNAVFVDVEKCVACRKCEVACALNSINAPDILTALSRDIPPETFTSVEKQNSQNIVIQCRHCQINPCVEVCKPKAIIKEDGVVYIKLGICIGCGECIIACPMGAINIDPKNQIAQKCFLCRDMDIPACVAACPTNALIIGDFDLLEHEEEEYITNV